MPDFIDFFRVLAALALGSIVGLERDLRDKPAGFRTMGLICVGACLFTIISLAAGGGEAQSTRVAAQIVTGIGFLGAGAIIRDRQTVIGLTTAATIWAVAAIGMAVGFGMLALATSVTALVLVALTLFSVVEKFIGNHWDSQEYRVEIAKSQVAAKNLFELIERGHLRVTKRDYFESDAALILRLTVRGRKADHERLRWDLINASEFALRET